MKKMRHEQIEGREKVVLWMCPLGLFLVSIFVGGCSIWNANLEPNYNSSRANRLCHPYGECSQGTWVAVDGAEPDPSVAQNLCDELIAQRYENGEWENSVAKGLEVGRCMEKKGYRLQK